MTTKDEIQQLVDALSEEDAEEILSYARWMLRPHTTLSAEDIDDLQEAVAASQDIPENLLVRLRRMAEEENETTVSVIQKVMKEKMRDYHPRPRSIGVAASGYSDTAQRTSEERPEPRAWR